MTSLIRLMLILLVGSSAAAVGVSRIAPAPTPWRMPSAVDHVMINAFYLDPSLRGTLAVERDGCRMRPVGLAEGEILDQASCSPWRDENGEAHVVGRWSQGPGEGDENLFGLARVTFPGGVLIDRVATDVVPISTPAWYPGTRARILFSAGDGGLYDYAFERPAGDPRAVERDQAPTRLAWTCPTPGLGEVYLNDPHWPADPNFDRVVFVTLRMIEPASITRNYSSAKVWWLRLGAEGRTIEAAGPLREPTQANPEVEERCPVVAPNSSGEITLGFFRKDKGQTWSLWTVPIGFRATDRRIPTVAGRERRLSDHCLPCKPIFSSDGRHISSIQVDDSGQKLVRRIEIEEDLAAVASSTGKPAH